MAIVYYKLDANFESCTSIEAKIAKLEILIDMLFASSVKIAGTSNHASYKIDDGQTVQEVFYRSPAEIMKAIAAYEKQKQYYMNKLIGNVAQNIGSKNLNRRRF